jgi:hypothetical protein
MDWWWGKSETSDKRLLPSAYDDYVTQPRVRSVKPGKFLPNPRKVAISAFQPQPSVSEWSHFMTYFGQYIDHDATLTAGKLGLLHEPSMVRKEFGQLSHRIEETF